MTDSTFPCPTTPTRSIGPTPALELTATTVTPTFRLDPGFSQAGDHPGRGRASKHGIQARLAVGMPSSGLVDDPCQTRHGDEITIGRLERQQSDDQPVSDRRPSTTASGHITLDTGTISETLQKRPASTGRAGTHHAQMITPTLREKSGKPVHRSASIRASSDAPASASSEDQRQSVSLCCSTRVHFPLAVGVSREKSPRRSTCVMT